MALTQDDRKAGGRASGVARRRAMLDHADKAQTLAQIVDTTARENIGPELLQMALGIARIAGNTEITPETALEVKQLADAAQILHKMGRLELGESTANTAVVNVTDAFAKQRELDARLAALKDGQQG